MSISKLRAGAALLILVLVMSGVSGVWAAAHVSADSHDPLAVASEIDRLVEKRLSEARIPASPLAEDAEFLRRVTLDLTGRIPSLERATAFLDSKDPEKRRKLIDQLLASHDFSQHFATVWRNLLAPANPVKGKAAPDRFSPWLADQLSRERGWHEIVAELLTVEGDVAQKPQSSFLMANSENFRPQANLLAASSARFFLGVQLRCAECHNHPFATWKQTDFWGIAAFFGRLHIGPKKGPPFLLTEVFDGGAPPMTDPPAIKTASGGAIVIPASVGKGAGQLVKAQFLSGEQPALGDDGPWRPTFVAWLTSTENPYFANAFVNRTWAQLFGRGFVNPVDDFRDDNPAAHPAVLALLAGEFRTSGHNVKHLLRCICNSQAYQRTSRPLPGNENDRTLFSHMAVKALSAEAFYDSLTVVLSVNKFAQPPSSKPAALREARDDFVRFFRAQGEATDETAFQQGIPQFLKRLNSEPFNSGAPLIDRLVRSGASRPQVLEGLYLATLSRRPTAEEIGLMSGYLSRRSDPNEGYAGVLWILLSSGEFVLNH